jgi:methyl-accepting chemotaxis protein
LRGELLQIRSLTGHAILALQSSFFELDQLVRAQRDSLDSVLASDEDPEHANRDLSIATFVGEVGPLVRSLDELVTRVVGTSADGARQMEELTADVGQTLLLLRQFEGVEAKAFMIGVNAKIEAARAGEQGRTFAIVAQEVRSLAAFSKDMNRKVGEQLVRAHGALRQVRQSLVDSASRDVESAAQSRTRIHDLLTRLSELDTKLSVDLGEIRTISQRVTEQVAIAVQALQFEDMTSQLIESSLKRLDRIESSLSAMEAVAQSPTHAPSDFEGLLDAQCELIAERHRGAIGSAVSQQDTSSGDVEFF